MRPELKILNSRKYPAGEYIRNRTLQSIPFWVAAAVTACLAVAYAAAFTAIEEFTVKIYEQHPLWLFAITPVCFALSWFAVRRWSPEAAGSGIPQLIASLDMDPKTDEAALDRLFGVRMAVVKWCSSMVAAVGGGIIGREGPTLQISGAVFHFVRKRMPGAAAASHASMMVAGAAAGLAAAFNTPLGGIVYVVEELAKVHLSNFRTSILQAVLVAGLFSQWLAGSYLYLGFPTLQTVPATFLGVCVLVGAITGGAGAVYGRVLLLVLRWTRGRSMREGAAIAVTAGILFAALVFISGEHALGSGRHLLLDLLFHSDHGTTFKDAAARFIGGILSYSAGGAGGIFSPSLAAGATIGSLFQPLISYQAPHLLVLVGMVGFLTGVTQTPFTSFVLVFEMTDRHSSIFFLMIAAMVGHGVSRLISQESFYEAASRNFRSQ